MCSRAEDEEYLIKRLKKELEKSSVNRESAEKMEAKLGVWTTVKKSSEFLKKHPNTIYNMIHDGILITRKNGRAIRIFTKSLIFALGEIEEF